MPGLGPGIHVFFLALLNRLETWMAGTSPAMTRVCFRQHIVYDCGEPAIFPREKSARAKKSSEIINLKN
jgi:hypothetical protein